MRAGTTFFTFILFFYQAANAGEYNLKGFKPRVKNESFEKVKIYVEDKETGACKIRGEIKVAALMELASKKNPEFVGLHGNCNLAGFKFSGSRTFWFHIGNLNIAETDAWRQYQIQVGPNIDCPTDTVYASDAKAPTTRNAVALGFCGG